MIIKEIKNYSGRLRINITAKDNLNANEDVILMTTAEYEEIKDSILDLQNRITVLTNENNMLLEMESKLRQSMADKNNQIDEQLKNLLEVALQPINEQHKFELESKDKIISDKDNELKSIRAVLNKFTTSISGLSLWDLIRGKHKVLINDFHDSIWVNVPLDQVQEVEKLPKSDD